MFIAAFHRLARSLFPTNVRIGLSLARALSAVSTGPPADAAIYLKELSLSGAATGDGYPAYTRYYRAQALFQGDVETWEQWNAGLVRELQALQAKDGSFSGFAGRGVSGGTVDTALALLSLAVNDTFLPVYER